jgi:hypothetical protein
LDLQAQENTHGGGCAGPEQINYTYTATFAVLVCKGTAQVKKVFDETGVVIWEAGGTNDRCDLTVYDGTQTTPDPLIEADKGVGATPAFMGNAYCVFDSFDVSPYGNRIPLLSFEVEAAETVTIGEIVEGEILRAGLTGAQYNVTAGTEEVTGAAFSGDASIAENLTTVLKAFAYDLVEIDGVITLIERGGAAALTLPYTHLGAGGNGDGQRYEIKYLPERELPTRVEVGYMNPASAYQVQTEAAIRHTKPHLQETTTISLPLAMTPTQAKQAAERLLYTMWREREVVQVVVPPQYLMLAPSDVLTLELPTYDGGYMTRRMRIEEMTIPPFGAVSLQCVPDGIDVLTQSAAGGGGTNTPVSRTEAVPTAFKVFSGVEVVDDDKLRPAFIVVGNGGDGWQGGTVYYSPDAGTTWINTGKYLRGASAFGAADSALADWGSATGWDSTNSFDVTLEAGTLAPATQSEVDNGDTTYWYVLGQETIGVSGVSLTGGSTYTLSTLKRRIRDTVGTGHTSSDGFAELRFAVRVPVDEALIGESVLVRVVSPYEALSAVTAQAVTIIAQTGAPYPTGSGTGNALVLWTGDTVQGVASLTEETTQFESAKPLLLPSDPTLSLQAATKAYVDSVALGGGGDLRMRIFYGG